MDLDVAARIIEIVAAIPRGRVSTYGQVAALAGSRSPRLTGRVLAELADHKTPWHRVLRADGRPVPHLADEQLRRLAQEDVPARQGRVDLARYQWQPTG